MMKRMKGSRFASLIIDGAMDASIMEQDIVSARTCLTGVTAVDFADLETTPKPDATEVKASVERPVEISLGEKVTVFNTKFVAIAADRAARQVASGL